MAYALIAGRKQTAHIVAESALNWTQRDKLNTANEELKKENVIVAARHALMVRKTAANVDGAEMTTGGKSGADTQGRNAG